MISEDKRNQLHIRRCQYFLKQIIVDDNNKDVEGLPQQLQVLVKSLDDKVEDISKSLKLHTTDFQELKNNQLELLNLVSRRDLNQSRENTTNLIVLPEKYHSNVIQTSRTDNAVEESNVEKISSLLQQQKDLSAQDIESERISHELLAKELGEMTDVLKDATLKMQESISLQNVKLDVIHKAAEENVDAILDQRKQINKSGKVMTKSLYSSLSSMFILIISFLVCYICIRIFPNP